MDIFQISDSQVVLTQDATVGVPANGFLWIDVTHDEVAADPEAWRETVARITGTQIYDLHLADVINLNHPSYFDSTQSYELVVFRKLALNGDSSHSGTSAGDDAGAVTDAKRKIPPALQKLATVPVSFILMEHALVTVHAKSSRTIDAARSRLLDYKRKPDGTMHGGRPSSSPEELMLRLVNAMVDQYLELRQPLTTQLDRWQRALLNPRRPFNDWMALLDARNEMHKLDILCEEQHDAMQELRDHIIDAYGDENSRAKDMLLVRINDVMEHITRVLTHARRLESSLESAVQIHFASVSHRTSEIMRTLTVITALFMPLTLVTGIFGMNFNDMPLLKDKQGFWITMGSMAVIVILLLFLFRRKRYLDD
jgi:magnesium transporter